MGSALSARLVNRTILRRTMRICTTNSYTEVRFYTSAAQLAEDKSYWPIYFAQNDAEGKAGTHAQMVLKGVTGNGEEVDKVWVFV